MKGWIYMLAATDGKRYIGRTTDFKRRMRQYTNPSRSNDSEIYRAINRMGFDSFEKIVLEVVEGDAAYVNAKLNELEANYIQRFDTVENGYNTCARDSHSRIVHFSEQVREKMRQSQKGRKHSEQSKAKRAGMNAYQSKKVRSDKLGKTFISLKEAANYVGLVGGCKISECIKGLRRSAGHDPLTGEPVSDWKFD